MVFENEINIYDPNAIANEFRTQSTQITAVQGKISAMITESQLQELMDGRVTMYDKLVSAEMDINGITTQVSELRQADGVLESEISTIRQTASSISAEVSAVKNNYAQKAQIILAINHVTQESEAVINASRISLAGKTIELTSDNISINSTYFKVNKNGEITATRGTFSGTLSAATGTFAGSLSAATGTFAGSLSAATGTFKGSLQAATGTFAGTLSAACITSGTMSAARIHGGTLKLGGSSDTNGVLEVYNAANQKVVVADKSGITVTNTAKSGYYASNVKTELNADGLVASSTYTQGSSPSFPIKIGLISGRFEYSPNSKGVVLGTIRSNSSQTADSSIYPYLQLSRSLIVTSGGCAFDSSSSTYVTQGTAAPYTDYSAASRKIFFQIPECRFYNVAVAGNLKVYGSQKDRVVRTEDYNYRALYSYELTSPMFGDVGSATIGEDGIAVIDIDDIMLETITSVIEYQVFLQKEGSGDLWVSEKRFNYFVVEGTPGLKFSWELKAKQRGNETLRIEDDGTDEMIADTGNQEDIIDCYNEELETLLREQEEVLYGNYQAA